MHIYICMYVYIDMLPSEEQCQDLEARKARLEAEERQLRRQLRLQQRPFTRLRDTRRVAATQRVAQ